MSYKEILGGVAVFLLLFSYGPYLWGIAKGTTKPHVFSWLVWTLLMGTGFAIQFSEQAGPGAWVNGFAAVFCASITLIALFKGEKSITRSDWISFLAALSALPLWLVTKDPMWSVILIALIDGLGFYPTIRKSWLKPFEETISLYFFGALEVFISLFAMENFNFNTTFYPIAMFILQAGFVILLLTRRYFLRQKSGQPHENHRRLD